MVRGGRISPDAPSSQIAAYPHSLIDRYRPLFTVSDSAIYKAFLACHNWSSCFLRQTLLQHAHQLTQDRERTLTAEAARRLRRQHGDRPSQVLRATPRQRAASGSAMLSRGGAKQDLDDEDRCHIDEASRVQWQ